MADQSCWLASPSRAISTLLITVIGHVEACYYLYLDSTRRLIIIINFNHSTSALFSTRFSLARAQQIHTHTHIATVCFDQERTGKSDLPTTVRSDVNDLFTLLVRLHTTVMVYFGDTLHHCLEQLSVTNESLFMRSLLNSAHCKSTPSCQWWSDLNVYSNPNAFVARHLCHFARFYSHTDKCPWWITLKRGKVSLGVALNMQLIRAWLLLAKLVYVFWCLVRFQTRHESFCFLLISLICIVLISRA